jgi:L-methionine (R)-S-oxide reductase
MNYDNRLKTAESLLNTQPNLVSTLSNASAFLNETIEHINWVGFYLLEGHHLTVGPFQGKVACSTIPLGKGVCGEAAQNNQTMVIKNVHEHENHIACDAHSNSEVVIPMVVKNQVIAVLDIDSPVFGRFDPELVSFLENFVILLVKIIDKYYPIG